MTRDVRFRFILNVTVLLATLYVAWECSWWLETVSGVPGWMWYVASIFVIGAFLLAFAMCKISAEYDRPTYGGKK